MKTQDERTKNLLTEVISPDNVLHIAESLALRAVTSMLKFSEKFYRKYKTDLCRDIAYRDTPNYVLTDSYDFVQTVALFLCEHYGEKAIDGYMISKKGKIITIQYHCYRLVGRILCAKSRRFKSDLCIDQYHIASADEFERFQDSQYDAVERTLQALNLTPIHIEAAYGRMAGNSFPEIGRMISRSAGTVHDLLLTVKRRYLKYISAK